MTDDFIPPEGFEPDDLFSARPRGRTLSRSQKHKAKHRTKRAAAEYVPFEHLPRRRRRFKTLKMAARIRADADGQGIFTSHDFLPGCKEWPVEAGGTVYWADILFLAQGKQPTVFFNATIETVAMAWAKRIEAFIEATIEAQMTPEDEERAFPRTFSRPSEYGREMVFAPPQGLPSLGGMTQQGAQAALLRRLWEERAGLVDAVSESATFEPGYAAGQGLTLVTAEPNLTVDAVVRAIEVFRARGEQPYTQPAEDFATHQSLIDALLKRKLWSWDGHQARAEGREQPPYPEDAANGGVESNAIRL